MSSRRTFALVAFALLALAGIAASQKPNWYIREVYNMPRDCTSQEAGNLKAFTAYNSGVCGAAGGAGYVMYTCAADGSGVEMKACNDATCSTNCTTTTLSFQTCASASLDVITTRCGDFQAGSEGLTTVAYSSSSCATSFYRTFQRANQYCSSSTTFIDANTTISTSSKLLCGSTITVQTCAGNANCEGCVDATYQPGACTSGVKTFCGDSAVAAAGSVIPSLVLVAALAFIGVIVLAAL